MNNTKNNTATTQSMLNSMTAQELRELINAATARLNELEAGKVQVTWECDWNNAARQRPYLAIIKKAASGSRYPLDYTFINEFWKESSKPNSACHAEFKGSLPAGTILKARTGGSMKNEYLDFYIVDANAENGIRPIEASEAMKLANQQ